MPTQTALDQLAAVNAQNDEAHRKQKVANFPWADDQKVGKHFPGYMPVGNQILDPDLIDLVDQGMLPKSWIVLKRPSELPAYPALAESKSTPIHIKTSIAGQGNAMSDCPFDEQRPVYEIVLDYVKIKKNGDESGFSTSVQIQPLKGGQWTDWADVVRAIKDICKIFGPFEENSRKQYMTRDQLEKKLDGKFIAA